MATDSFARALAAAALKKGSSVSGDMTKAEYDADNAVGNAGGIAAYVEEKTALKMNATDPTGSGAFSMNRKAGTTVGQNSHTEGMEVEASGRFSHAEGSSTKAAGMGAHAEGLDGTASGDAAHTEGMGTTAQGAASHAEGISSTGAGNASHAEGSGTRAASLSQHVQGENNIADTEGSATARGKYAHIVGNGASNGARSNAHTLDWDGNAWFEGDVYVGSTSGTNRDDGSKKLATEEYVTAATADFVPLEGSAFTFPGMTMVQNVATPGTDYQAANKLYVDGRVTYIDQTVTGISVAANAYSEGEASVTLPSGVTSTSHRFVVTMIGDGLNAILSVTKAMFVSSSNGAWLRISYMGYNPKSESASGNAVIRLLCIRM